MTNIRDLERELINIRERAKSGAMSVTAVIMKGPLSYLIVVLVTRRLNFASLCGRGILDRHIRCCT